jgi:hypothetical protein
VLGQGRPSPPDGDVGGGDEVVARDAVAARPTLKLLLQSFYLEDPRGLCVDQAKERAVGGHHSNPGDVDRGRHYSAQFAEDVIRARRYCGGRADQPP